MKLQVQEGKLGDKLPYIAIGRGEPVVFIRTVMPESGNPTGASRIAELHALKPYASQYKIYAVSRDPNHSEHGTMSDFAMQYAQAIQKEFGKAVPVVGVSTGGSLALQIAIDHPDVVSKLAVIAAGPRLSEQGRALQRTYASYLKKRDYRMAEQSLAPLISKTKVGEAVMRGLLWLTALSGRPQFLQMVGYLEAEDAFDVRDKVASVACPALLVAGESDKVYSVHDIQDAAKRMRQSRIVIKAKAGHRDVIADGSIAVEVSEFLRHL